MRLILAVWFFVGFAVESLAQSPPQVGIAVLRGERSTIVVRAPSRDANATLRRRQPDLAQRCGETLLIASEAGAPSLITPAGADFTALEASALLVITVIADEFVDAGCVGPWGLRPDTGERVLQISRDTAALAGQGVRQVRVSLDGERPLELLAVESHLLSTESAAGTRPTSAAFQRLALRMSEVAPGPARGPGETSLTVSVAHESGGADDVILLPWEVLRDVWQAELAARVATLTNSVPLVTLRAPLDRGLGDAATALANRGPAAEAIVLITRRANAAELTPADRTWARAQSAMALTLASDTLGARLTMVALLDEEPCFRWRADAPAGLREPTAGFASTVARCHAVSLWRVAGRAAVAPGFGRPALRDGVKRPRGAITAVVLASLLASQWQNSVALDHYDAYIAAQAIPLELGQRQPNLRNLYRFADHTRIKAKALSAFGIGVWVTNGVLELMAERRFAARLRETAAVGIGRPTAEVGWRPTLDLTPGRVSLGLRHTW